MIACDRWLSIAEIAARHGKSPKTLRTIAQQQNGIMRRTRSIRTLQRWPKFSKDPSGQWGCWESDYVEHFAEVQY